MRGVTQGGVSLSPITSFQLTRPMRGVTSLPRLVTLPYLFQLTRPMRGVTSPVSRSRARITISTHTPHAGRDENEAPFSVNILHFNSHAPCGA